MQTCPARAPDLVRVFPAISPPRFSLALMPVTVLPAVTRMTLALLEGNGVVMLGYHWLSQLPGSAQLKVGWNCTRYRPGRIPVMRYFPDAVVTAPKPRPPPTLSASTQISLS